MNCFLALITWFNKNQGFSMVLLTTVYVVATFLLVLYSHHANRIAQKNLDSLWKLERERVRPHIIIRFEFSMPLVSIVVSNIGLTSALDIRFDMDIKPTIAIHEKPNEPIRFLNTPLASLAPQESLSTVVGTWKNIREHWSTLAYSGSIIYKTSDGIEYSEPFSINLADHEGLLYSSKKGLHEIAEAIEYLAKDPSARRLSMIFPKPSPYTSSEPGLR